MNCPEIQTVHAISKMVIQEFRNCVLTVLSKNVKGLDNPFKVITFAG
jgi:hypothetical protein